jgi:hypothetical protein
MQAKRKWQLFSQYLHMYSIVAIQKPSPRFQRQQLFTKLKKTFLVESSLGNFLFAVIFTALLSF